MRPEDKEQFDEVLLCVTIIWAAVAVIWFAALLS